MHSLLHNVNDMGELRSEHQGNLTYWMMVFGSRFCGVCCCIMLVLIASFPLQFAEQGKANPGNVPPHLVLVVYLCCWIMCGFMVLYMIYIARRNRNKTPLLFASYEKGLVVVYRNRMIRRFFWEDIKKIQRHEKQYYLGLGKPVFHGVSIDLHGFEKPETYFPADFFQDAEKLYNSICEARVNIEKPP